MEQGSLFPPDRTGTRGGTTESYEEGEERIETYRASDAIRLRRAILSHAAVLGSVHADDVAYLDVAQRNSVGVAFRTLVAQGYLVSTGEHRKSALKAAHGRKSYVYKLTQKGDIHTAIVIGVNLP